MWRFVLRITTLISVYLVLYSQAQGGGDPTTTPPRMELSDPGGPDLTTTPPRIELSDTGDRAEFPGRPTTMPPVDPTHNGPSSSNEDHTGGRRKRSIIGSSVLKWDKCIVPYRYKNNFQENIFNTSIGFAIRLIEYYTGFRFKQYEAGATLGDNTQWGLTHSSYAKFVDGSGCWSNVGRSDGERRISSCSGYTAVHEIGHLLGLTHEHEHPEAIGGTLFHLLNIAKDRENLFVYTTSMETALLTEYDPSSFMHYFPSAFGNNSKDAITLLDEVDDRYLMDSGNWYYNFKDIQEFSKCLDEYDCSAAPANCINDGYRSIVNNVCTCICPKGLDPATGCSTKVNLATQVQALYPKGRYSLLKPLEGSCPTGTSPGHMVQYALNDQVHSPSDGYKFISPGYTAGKLVLDVCTKDDATGTGDWPAGSYCIIRDGGSCPTGFEEGYIQTNGTQPVTENTGSLPDGTHDQIFELYFCCRSDFDYREPVELPLSGVFILYSYDTNYKCQAVKDHTAVVSKYTFQSTGGIIQTGKTPHMWNPTDGSNHMYTYYCAYVPLDNSDCGVIKTLTNTDTEYNIISPGFANGNYPPKKSCIWHFTSPAGTTMQLNVNEFDVSSSCSSYILVKNWRPSVLGGRKFCGDDSSTRGTTWTHNNTLTVEFISGLLQESNKGFNLTVKLIRDADKCYVGDGSGGQYSGTVNYARNFMPCVNWNEVSHCMYDSFEPESFYDDLESNYCRTTGYAPKPWCYVDKESCQTQTCDACMTGACYDVFSDCAASKDADSNYCTKDELGEASRGCKQSCNKCSSHVPKSTVGSGTITCGMPLAITGVNMRPVKTAYAVGETVEYFCVINKVTVKRTCTSEGTWTDLNLVCGVCPEGWTPFDKRCNKWLGVHDTHNATHAQTVCESMGGTLPRVENQIRTDHLKKYVNVVSWNAGRSWLGLKKTNGVWKWIDGTAVSWTNWDSYQWYTNGDCAEMVTEGTWYKRPCDSNVKSYVVCEIELPDGDVATSCEDSISDCATFLASNPTSCEAYEEFAWHKCRRTCARDVCATTTVCTDSVSLGSAGSRTYPASNQIPQGNYVKYACNSGYYHTGGDLVRTCQLDGTLSGTDPVCTDAANTDSVVSSPHNALRRRTTVWTNWYIITATNETSTMRISVPGKITEWRYYSKNAGSVAFLVLRKHATANSYTVVGKNIVTVPDNRKSIARIPTEEQITVQVGDRIGFLYTGDNLPFTQCDSKVEPLNADWYGSSNWYYMDDLNVSQEIAFEKVSSYECRAYSVHAVINPSA